MRVLLVLTVLCTLMLTNAWSFTLAMPYAGITPTYISAPSDSSAPCPLPGPSDISNQLITSSTQNSTLGGHVVLPIKEGHARLTGDLGANYPLQLELVFKIRNPTEFQQCLDAINDPTSPYYEKFLNGTTLEPFLPTPGQKASIVGLLNLYGFNVTDAASPLVLNLQGNVRNVRSAFGVQLALYGYSGRSFFASNIDPELPSSLAGLVNGIVGLNNYTKPKPAESPCTGPYCPQGIQVGYTLSSLISAGHDGSGQTVAVVDEPGDPSPNAAMSTYDLQYGIPAVTINVVTPDGAPTSYDPGWGSEAAMDIEAVHSVAPGAGIVLAYVPSTFDIMDGIDYVATNHLANVISNSWTYACNTRTCPDTELPPSFVNSEDARLATDTALGVTIVFASGDSGSNPGGSLGPEFPSSDPNVLGAGATNLVLTGCGTTTCTGYGSEVGASISGGGYSGHFSEPSWQASTIGTKSGRGVPDVSMLGFSPSFWVYSTLSDRCGRSGSTTNSWFGCAGTSLSTPLWAGFLAIMIQVRGGAQLGNMNPRLYQLASSLSYSTIFHDITSGSNGVYSASTGWDPVTGWGSPQANNLALAFAAVLTTNVASGSGSVSPNCPSGCPEGYGAPISVSATASGGWVFSGWVIAGTSCSSGNAATPCSFTMPPNPVTVSASFLQITSITMTVTPQSIAFGSSIQLSGSITPNPGTVQVALSLSPDNVSWNPITYVNTDSSGSYSTSWTPPYPGSYGLRASWASNIGFQGATSSPPEGLRVTGTRPAASTLLLTVPTSVGVGQTTRLSITLFNPTTSPISTLITIEVLGPNSYVSIDTVRIQVAALSSETLLYDWVAPNQTGTYIILAGTLPPLASTYDSQTITVN